MLIFRQHEPDAVCKSQSVDQPKKQRQEIIQLQRRWIESFQSQVKYRRGHDGQRNAEFNQGTPDPLGHTHSAPM